MSVTQATMFQTMVKASLGNGFTDVSADACTQWGATSHFDTAKIQKGLVCREEIKQNIRVFTLDE